MATNLTDLTPKKHDWRWVFLEVLSKSCCVSEACVAAKVSRDTAYRHRERFPRFRRKWDEAIEVGVEALEVLARRRAFDTSDPASHVLTMFLLKAHKPQKYRDNGHQIPPAPIEDDDGLSPDALANLSQDDLNTLESIAKKLTGPSSPGTSEDPG